MSDIERKAREVLAYECPECGGENGHESEDGWLRCSRCSNPHDMTRHQAMQAIIAALTPPEGYVLVPVEPTEAQWGGLARDVIMWMECYQTRSADSLLKHLNRCGNDIPKWLMEEVKGGSHSLAKGTVAAIIYKAMLEDRPEAK